MSQLLVSRHRQDSEKQNVKVVVRIRPLNSSEVFGPPKTLIRYVGNKDILARDKRFKFDWVFRTDTHQLEVYKHVIASMIPDVLAGYNCTVFAYGATGSGKTYTMTGNNCEPLSNWLEDDETGIIPRAATHIFELLPAEGPDRAVKVSYLELYNEEIRDLLSDDDRPLNLFSDTKGGVFIQGLTEINICDSVGICKQLQKGNLKRVTAPTLINHQSSRSHTVFTVTVFTKESLAGNEDVLKTGKINFIDLAGSENIARSGCKEMRAVELANINKSLLTLGRVIHTLADKTKKHVPYRDSKLTRILQDSLGGHTKTCIVATVSPAFSATEETLSTLDYASRARDIKNSPTVNEKLDANRIIDNMRETIKRLELDLEACRSGTGFYITKEHHDALMEELETLREFKRRVDETLKEKDAVIEQLKEKIDEMNRQFQDSVEKNKRSREAVTCLEEEFNDLKLSFKQEQYVSKNYEKDAEQLRDQTQKLINTMERCVQQNTLLQNKLEKQYHINTVNECLARDSICKVLDLINELSNLQESLTEANEDMYDSCRDDIAEFTFTVEVPLETLKRFFKEYDENMAFNLSIKENVMTMIKKFVFVTRTKIYDIRANFADCNNARSKLVLQLPKDIDMISLKVLKAVDEMVVRVNDYFTVDDAKLNNRLEQLEQEFITRQKEEEAFHKLQKERSEALQQQISLLRKDFLEQQNQRKETVVVELAEVARKTNVEIKEVTDTFVNAYKEIDDTISSTTFDELIKNCHTFYENFTSEYEKLETKQVDNCLKIANTLKHKIEEFVGDLLTSVNNNYESITFRLGYLMADSRVGREKMRNLREAITLFLTDEFLQKIVSVEHEGDTPLRQPEIVVPRTIQTVTPRETLLARFSSLPDDEEASTSALPLGEAPDDSKNE